MSGMSMTPSPLPQGVWQNLLQHAYTLVDEIEAHGIKNPFWTLGGGTVLMLRFRHREAFLKQLDQRRAVVKVQFEAIDTLEYQPSYGRAWACATEFLTAL